MTKTAQQERERKRVSPRKVYEHAMKQYPKTMHYLQSGKHWEDEG